MHNADWQIKMHLCAREEPMLNMFLNCGRKTVSEEIVEEIEATIICNRKEIQAAKENFHSNFVLKACIAGLLHDTPMREVLVPGNLMLAAVHDSR
jgi:hypothetical protein